jgi:hypothetical protein
MDHVEFSIVRMYAWKMEAADTIIHGHSQRLRSKEKTHIQFIDEGMMAAECALGVLFWIIDGLFLTTHIYLCDTIAISI